MIQIDMQMPKNCLDCPACNEYLICAIPVNGRGFGENDVSDFSQGRPKWCPMKEQEAIEPDVDSEGTCSCGNCGTTVGHYPAGCSVPEKSCKYCPECGHEVKWE